MAQTDTDATTEGAAPKSLRKPVMIGVALALVLGGAGFFAAFSGLVPGLGGDKKAEEMAEVAPVPGGLGAFVALEPITLSLGPASAEGRLRLRAELEVTPAHVAEVEAMRPRVMDVLTSYLRALDVAELQDPAALIRLRAHMLRRIQLVTGEGRVRDLLVTEFIIN